jgi:hypothetical protein
MLHGSLPTLRAQLAAMQIETDGLSARVDDLVDHLERPRKTTMLRVLETKAAAADAAIAVASAAKQHGFIRLPYSVHRSAYGWIPIPVASIKNGKGPRILLMAGNHGDEYEGQVALGKLIRSLDPAEVRGPIIILPSANFPAAMAGMRTSPLDEGNLNRSFPGDPYGGPTAQIADYIESVLLPQCDFVVDFHSGRGAPAAQIESLHPPRETARTSAPRTYRTAESRGRRRLAQANGLDRLRREIPPGMACRAARPRTCSDNQQYWLATPGRFGSSTGCGRSSHDGPNRAWPGPMSLRAAASAARSEVPRTDVGGNALSDAAVRCPPASARPRAY